MQLKKQNLITLFQSKIGYWIPFVILGVFSVCGGLITLVLPETLGEKLPDSLEDGELFFSKQPIIYNPLKKRCGY